jgi:hypothetical protein
VVDVLGRVGRRVEDVLELDVDVAAGAEPGEAVIGERGPGLGEDEDDHPADQQQHQARDRAEDPLDARVAH